MTTIITLLALITVFAGFGLLLLIGIFSALQSFKKQSKDIDNNEEETPQ